MKILLDKLGISIKHLKLLEKIFLENHDEYKRIENVFRTQPFKETVTEISKELYAGGKQLRGNDTLNRQMVLGDIIEYIFTGRAYYYATKSEDNFNNFLKLILYSVNQLLIFDSITVNSDIRRKYLKKLEDKIDINLLYEKEGDKELAKKLMKSNTVYEDSDWEEFDLFVDSILPKTLGCPKELVVFAELIRLKKGIIIPLLLNQKIFGDRNPIAPPDFLLLRENKEIFGIELGYKKEEQSREFTIRTSIPTFAVDLENNLHNRCPKCGEFILYCDPVIEAYSNGTLNDKLDSDSGRFLCLNCPNFEGGNCKYSNYYGKRYGKTFNGDEIESGNRHYHSKCVLNGYYKLRHRKKPIIDHKDEFFAQIPKIQGLENL